LTLLPVRYNPSYTGVMKTAVSLPDEIFKQAEATAKKLRMSRSRLYANAISEYLKRHRDDSITERLNQVYSKHDSKPDPAFERAMLETLAKDPW
jgi:predicted transcriptional regulator